MRFTRSLSSLLLTYSLLVTISSLVPLIFDSIFSKLPTSDYSYDEAQSKASVVFQMYELFNELVRDLLQIPSGTGTPQYLELDESAEKGVFVKHGSSVKVTNAPEGVSHFRQGWARKVQSHTDFGPAHNHATIILHLDLTMRTGDSPLPHRSRLTIVKLAGSEKLSDESIQLRMREGPTLNKSVVGLSQYVAALANQPYPDRNVSSFDAKLPNILKDEIGGNCKTRAIVCLKPDSDPNILTGILRFCSQLSQVVNFPVLNDSFTQQLVTQFRAKILTLKGGIGLGAGLPNTYQLGDVQDELRRIQTENLELRDRNERLHERLEQVQGRFGNLATTKTDLSSQLLLSEEEKLKVSKTLVDLQIENNKLKEEHEKDKFELTNKILALENDLLEVELERNKYKSESHNAKERLAEMEKDRKDLADEYVTLKTNYIAINKDHEQQSAKLEELSMELLNLVNAKATLLRQMENMERLHGIEHEDPAEEIARVRAVVTRLSKRPGKDELVSERDRQSVQMSVFGDEKRFKGKMDKIHNQYDKQQKTLENKVATTKKHLNDARNLARERQTTISQLNAQLITARSSRDQLESERNRLQHKLKDINEEYKSRLNQYVRDIAEYIDKPGRGQKFGEDEGAAKEKLTKYVHRMIKDLRTAHKHREEQLSQAVQTMNKQLHQVIKRHEGLLIAYRDLRQQVDSLGIHDIELGPDESDLQMKDKELQSRQEQEIFRLKDELEKIKSSYEATKLRLNVGFHGKDNPALNLKNASDSSISTEGRQEDTWNSLRKQLREFTLNTQQELESERADLISKNTMLEEQVHQLQSYIDTQLARYGGERTRRKGYARP
ncbi:unnamed protein product [Owenia fusiformis]|uniref:Kinesin motor domain-containing protein n=1 Tax=Owenia fusiformis TaxID=6347 RepID=A0A8S4MV72_OWEFU|nr:unnamed protein product [Owenia fusiformis]